MSTHARGNRPPANTFSNSDTPFFPPKNSLNALFSLFFGQLLHFLRAPRTPDLFLFDGKGRLAYSGRFCASMPKREKDKTRDYYPSPDPTGDELKLIPGGSVAFAGLSGLALTVCNLNTNRACIKTEWTT